jgi:oligoribonuclease (3'-5' exoribonuclease)
MQQLPNYIRAKTPEGLKKLCMENSIKKDRYFVYKIMFDGKNWFAWYEEDVSNVLQDQVKASEIDNGASQ